MTETFDRNFWERRWSQALRGARTRSRSAGRTRICSQRPRTCGPATPSTRAPVTALRASGSPRGDGGSRDFSAVALDHARSRAESLGADVAEDIEWIEGDLATWTPPPDHYDLVTCLYVHVAGSVPEMVRRLAAGVARGGTMLLVGHRPVDPATGVPTPAAGQVQVSVDTAVAALDPRRWEIIVAEDRPREATGTGVDAVVRARRLA